MLVVVVGRRLPFSYTVYAAAAVAVALCARNLDSLERIFSSVRLLSKEREWIEWWEVDTPTLCPWVLVDGVKVRHDDGWALALPDPSEPVTHVWAEAGSDVAARRLAQEYARRIRQLLR